MGSKVKRTPHTRDRKEKAKMRRELKLEKLRKKRKGYKSKRAFLRAIRFNKIKDTANV